MSALMLENHKRSFQEDSMQDGLSLNRSVLSLSSVLASLLINRTNLAAVARECFNNSWTVPAKLINSLHRSLTFLGISRKPFDALNFSRLHAQVIAV